MEIWRRNLLAQAGIQPATSIAFTANAVTTIRVWVSEIRSLYCNLKMLSFICIRKEYIDHCILSCCNACAFSLHRQTLTSWRLNMTILSSRPDSLEWLSHSPWKREVVDSISAWTRKSSQHNSSSLHFYVIFALLKSSYLNVTSR